MGGKRTIALILALSLLASGCGSGAGEQRNEEKITAQKLAQSVREKYADEEAYEYEEAIQDIGRDEHLKLQMGFDIMDAGFDEYTQIAAVYQDPGDGGQPYRYEGNAAFPERPRKGDQF